MAGRTQNLKPWPKGVSGNPGGGNYYQPQGSIWYFPQAYRLDQHGKLLMMAPSMDRAGALGFSCVMDAQ